MSPDKIIIIVLVIAFMVGGLILNIVASKNGKADDKK